MSIERRRFLTQLGQTGAALASASLLQTIGYAQVVRGPARFGSSSMTRGSYTKKVRRRGTYTIVCTIHGASDQKMKLVVK